jgi:hypothetical protein
MESFPKRIVIGILGVALTLGVWTVKGWFTGEANATVAHIPDKAWDGGGGSVVIEAESTDPARVSVTFETRNPVDSADHKMLETWERIGPGQHTWTIEVPAGVGGTAEVDAEGPQVGSRVRVAVKIGGRTVAEDSLVLHEPLRGGDGFFAQVHLEDYATGKEGGE